MFRKCSIVLLEMQPYKLRQQDTAYRNNVPEQDSPSTRRLRATLSILIRDQRDRCKRDRTRAQRASISNIRVCWTGPYELYRGQ